MTHEQILSDFPQLTEHNILACLAYAAIKKESSKLQIAGENISWRIKKLLPQWDILPVNEIRKGQRLSDMLIWKFAKENQYTILTFDEDFSEISLSRQK